MNINDLPNEVIQHVFSFLDMRTRVAAQLTCKRWDFTMRCVSQPPVRLGIDYSNFYLFPEPACEVWRTDYGLWDTHVVSETVACSFLAQNTRGNALSLETESVHLAQCLNIVERHWTQLERLQIFNDHCKEDDLLTIADLNVFSKVTHLWLPRTILSTSALNYLFARCTNLEKLCLWSVVHEGHIVLPSTLRSVYMGHITLDRFERFFGGQQDKMKEFGCRTKDQSLLDLAFGTMTNLVSLKFCHTSFEVEHIRALEKFERLKNLRLSPKTLDVAEFLKILPKLSKLVSFHVGGPWFSLEVLRSIITYCGNLEHLRLFLEYSSKENRDVEAALDELVQLVPLTTLTIGGCLAYSSSLVELIRRSISLRNVDISRTRRPEGYAVLEAMNEKAMANPTKLFWLRTYDAYGNHGSLSKNLVHCSLEHS